MITRILSAVKNLFLTGLLFTLFLLGYAFYGILWMFRFMRIKKTGLVFAITGCLLVGAGAGFWYLFMPLDRAGETVSILVSRGCRVSGIADSLARHKVITSRQALMLWLKTTGTDRRIQAGRYLFATQQGVLAAARSLNRPALQDITVTIPEGCTIEQTAQRIAQVFPFDTAEIIRLCRDTAFIRTTGLEGIASLEGYLFPDTYRFLETSSPEEVVQRMVARFDEAWTDIDTIESPSLTKKEIVILASIVEKEAVLDAERPRIAGVFSNRLAVRLPLGADPTVRYALKKFSGPLLYHDLNITSRYNTRRYAGLPPGPICSPGQASLIAAMSPMRTNELYFVARWDGSGAHDFSVTNEEHSRKKLVIRYRNEKRIHRKGDSCGK